MYISPFGRSLALGQSFGKTRLANNIYEMNTAEDRASVQGFMTFPKILASTKITCLLCSNFWHYPLHQRLINCQTDTKSQQQQLRICKNPKEFLKSPKTSKQLSNLTRKILHAFWLCSGLPESQSTILHTMTNNRKDLLKTGLLFYFEYLEIDSKYFSRAL